MSSVVVDGNTRMKYVSVAGRTRPVTDSVEPAAAAATVVTTVEPVAPRSTWKSMLWMVRELSDVPAEQLPLAFCGPDRYVVPGAWRLMLIVDPAVAVNLKKSTSRLSSSETFSRLVVPLALSAVVVAVAAVSFGS